MTWNKNDQYGPKNPGYKHGESSKGKLTPEYITWRSMLSRCLNNKSQAWSHYGGRGISVCKRWLEFGYFLSDMGRRPSSDYSIDRIDNHGNYEPNNCRWATRSEQQRNRRIKHIGPKDRYGHFFSRSARDGGTNNRKWSKRKYIGPLLGDAHFISATARKMVSK